MKVDRLVAGALVAALPLVVCGEFEKSPEPKNVPPLLVAASGEAVASREQWERVRRPEIAKVLLEQEYGVRPVERPADISFAETAAPEECYGGKALRKRVRATYSGPGGEGRPPREQGRRPPAGA